MAQPARRCHRELTWPGDVWRKWLKREARDDDFSADEDGSETEADDDEMVDWKGGLSNEGKRGEGLQFAQNEKLSEAFPCKFRRRNSETLRAHYIDSKELRICVGTWNVGGKMPQVDLDIEDWLDMEEAADIYVLGFEEVVPLSAGNIFGPADSRPVPKWEHLISETLNRIQPVKPKYKCYSDPSSPSRFKPSEDDPVIEDGIFYVSDSEGEEEIHPFDEDMNMEREVGCTSIDKESRVSEEDHRCGDANLTEKQHSIKRLDRLHCLRFAENDINLTSTSSQLKPILTKTLTTSERIGLSWPEQPLNLVPERALERPLSFQSLKSFRAANSFKLPKIGDHQGLAEAFMLQELDLESIIKRKRRSPFVRIVSKQMVGIFLSVWARRSLRRHIQNLKLSTVGVGAMGYIGNKGSISVSMSIYQTPFCFICSHLTSGEKEGDELKRNADVQEIHRRTHFDAKSILDHERIIWFGDLNYRIDLSYEKTREHISKKEWAKLAERDQLTRELKKGRAFDGWTEGILNFPPTYKYELNSEKYFGDNPKAGRRTPAWCDRILSFGKGMKLLKYRRIENKLSDHRPVSATFMAEVEVFCQRKLQKALTYTDAEIENGGILADVGIEVDLGRLRVGEDLPGWER